MRLSTYLDVDDIDASEWDEVIVATGSIPRVDGVEQRNPGEPAAGIDQPHVMSSNDVMADRSRNFGQHAVIFDDAGHFEGLAVSEYLAALGVQVNFVTRLPTVAQRMENAQMVEPSLIRLAGSGFQAYPRSRMLSIGKNDVVIAPNYLPKNTNQTQTLPADIVVFISDNLPNRSLHEALLAKGIASRVVGDSNAPRYLPNAIRDGYLAGAAV